MIIANLTDQPHHLPTLAGWHHQEWARYNPGDTVAKRIARMQAQLGKGPIPTTFVAVANGELLGSASLVEFDMHGRTDLTPWLASVFVAPATRGRGIGTALVGRVVEEASRIGVETLYLFTPDRESFYARMGWQVHERTQYMAEVATIMSLQLVAGRGKQNDGRQR